MVYTALGYVSIENRGLYLNEIAAEWNEEIFATPHDESISSTEM